MNFPTHKGERATAEFQNWFNSYQIVSIGDKLIESVLTVGKLSRCPNFKEPEFCVTNIERKGLLGRKIFVTIERL